MGQPQPMPSGHFDQMIPDIFYYAKWFISEYQAYIMIGTAISLASAILIMIVNLFDRNKDDDDGYDYREI